MYLIIKKTEYNTLTPSYNVERNSNNKELADNLAKNLNDEAQENDTGHPVSYIVVELDS